MVEISEPGQRKPLSRRAVLAAAMRLADTDGLAALTIRSLARELGVKPMSLYHHVANKDEILTGLVDEVYAQMALPMIGEPWRDQLRIRAQSARAVFARHPWALALIESRRDPGPATLQHLDAVIGTLRSNGFSVAATAHAFPLLDAYVFGFALQETTLPFDDTTDAAVLATELVSGPAAEQLPYLVELATDHVLQPDYDFGDEFDIGLELVLDAVASLRQRWR